MPDEQSNLNLPSSTRRPSGRPGGRRRGRRGGRGRGRVPRPAGDKTDPTAEELPPEQEGAKTSAPETGVENAAESEADTSGDFREPHPEEPSDADAMPPEDISSASAPGEAVPEPVAESQPPPEPERRPERHERAERPERQERQERQERPPQHQHEQRHEQRRPEQRQWAKPADFRPADISAVSQAVAHATEIAEHLRHTLDQLDEILELVELAERQKLADEREIDELRRALRRIQPPRHQQQHQPYQQRGPRQEEPHRGHHGQRHEDRPPRQEAPENIQRLEDPPASAEPAEPESNEPGDTSSRID